MRLAKKALIAALSQVESRVEPDRRRRRVLGTHPTTVHERLAAPRKQQTAVESASTSQMEQSVDRVICALCTLPCRQLVFPNIVAAHRVGTRLYAASSRPMLKQCIVPSCCVVQSTLLTCFFSPLGTENLSTLFLVPKHPLRTNRAHGFEQDHGRVFKDATLPFRKVSCFVRGV